MIYKKLLVLGLVSTIALPATIFAESSIVESIDGSKEIITKPIEDKNETSNSTSKTPNTTIKKETTEKIPEKKKNFYIKIQERESGIYDSKYEIKQIKEMTNDGLKDIPTHLQKTNIITMENGQITYKVQNEGLYEVKQINRAINYALDNSFIKTVQFPSIADSSSDDQIITLTSNANKIKAKYAFTNENENGGALSDVTYELIKTHEPKKLLNNLVIEWKEVINLKKIEKTSNNQGSITFDNLTEGKYKVVQTKSNNEYDIDKTANTFTITTDKNGKPTIISDTLAPQHIIKHNKGISLNQSFIENNKSSEELTAAGKSTITIEEEIVIPKAFNSYKKANFSIKLPSEFNNIKVIDIKANNKKTQHKSEIKDNELKIDLKSKPIDHNLVKIRFTTNINKTNNKETIPVPEAIINYQTDNDIEKTVKTNKLNINIKNGYIRFNAVDNKNKPLQNCLFDVYIKTDKKTKNTIEYEGKQYTKVKDVTDNSDLGPIKSNNNGQVIIKNIPYGDYIISSNSDNYPSSYTEFSITKDAPNVSLGTIKIGSSNKLIIAGIISTIIIVLSGIGFVYYKKFKKPKDDEDDDDFYNDEDYIEADKYL